MADTPPAGSIEQAVGRIEGKLSTMTASLARVEDSVNRQSSDISHLKSRAAVEDERMAIKKRKKTFKDHLTVGGVSSLVAAMVATAVTYFRGS